jgi:hypothetical protein
MGQNTTKGNGGTDQGVQLFVAADGKLKMTRADTLDLEILGRVLYFTLGPDTSCA